MKKALGLLWTIAVAVLIVAVWAEREANDELHTVNPLAGTVFLTAVWACGMALCLDERGRNGR
jgi:hypothetical protein